MSFLVFMAILYPVCLDYRLHLSNNDTCNWMSPKTFEIPLPRVEIKVGVIRTATVQPGVFGDLRKSFPRPASSDV